MTSPAKVESGEIASELVEVFLHAEGIGVSGIRNFREGLKMDLENSKVILE